MLMKQREGTRRERGTRIQSQPSPGDDALCSGHFRGLWILGPPSSGGPCEIYRVVAVSLSADWCGDWLGHVSLLALTELRAWGGSRAQIPVPESSVFGKLELTAQRKGGMTGGDGFAQGCRGFHKETGRNTGPASASIPWLGMSLTRQPESHAGNTPSSL